MTTHKRSGFTLLETLLVLAIMVSLFALSWPAIRGPLAKARLKRAARDVQTSLGKARARAVEHGAAYAFRYEIDGNEFQILAWDALAAEEPIEDDVGQELLTDSFDAQAASTNSSDEEGGSSMTALLRRGESLPMLSRTLPEGVRFVEESADDLLLGDSADGTSFAANPVAGGGATADTDRGGITDEGLLEESSVRWSRPIVFWPNGRSQNARVLIRDVRNYSISVELRGLTGIARYGAAVRPTVLDEDVDGEFAERGTGEAGREVPNVSRGAVP